MKDSGHALTTILCTKRLRRQVVRKGDRRRGEVEGTAHGPTSRRLQHHNGVSSKVASSGAVWPAFVPRNREQTEAHCGRARARRHAQRNRRTRLRIGTITKRGPVEVVTSGLD